MKVKFIKAETYRDHEFLLANELEAFGKSAGGYVTTEQLYDHMECYRVMVDDRPAGYCILKMTGQKAILDRAGVFTEFRGQGLQRKMINFRVRRAKAFGYQTVKTYTSVDNAASMRNLIKCGFKPYWPEGGDPEENFVYFVKEIKEARK